MVHEQVGNRAIPMVSVAGTLAIMAILMLNRSGEGQEPIRIRPWIASGKTTVRRLPAPHWSF